MKLALVGVLCALAAVDARHIRSTEVSACLNNSVLLDGNHYKRGARVDLSGFPADIGIDWKTGNLFFTYVQYTLSMKLYVVKKGSDTAVKIQGLPSNGQSVGVDQSTGTVYLATDDGLFTYDAATNSGVRFGPKDVDVMYLDVANDRSIYYVTWQGHKVYRLPADKQSPAVLFEKIPSGHGLAVDRANNFYYEIDKVAYMLKDGAAEGVKIKNLAYDSVADYFVDKHDSVWVANDNGDLYKVNKRDASADLVGNLGFSSVNTIGIDSDDNIIVGVEDGLEKLEKLGPNQCV